MLDLKYRPSRFADVLGNAGTKKLLLLRSKEGKLTERSLFFGGPKGCGKTSMARISARAMTCDSVSDGEPCNQCPSCLAHLDGMSVSIEELDAASQGSVDRVRQMVRELEYGSIDGRKRVVIFDEAQRLTAQAQDALLTPVENRSMVIILCTTEPNKIRGPIRQRVWEFTVAPPDEKEMVSFLTGVCAKENIASDPASLARIARHVEYCPRACLTALDSCAILGGVNDASLRELFKIQSYELISELLLKLDSDPAASIVAFDSVITAEGPSWVREAIMLVISVATRHSIGVRSPSPFTSTDFFSVRKSGWIDLSRRLSLLDRPTAPGIEAALFSITSPVQVQPQPVAVFSNVPAQIQTTQIPAPAKVHKETPTANNNAPKAAQLPIPPKELDVGGVKFSAEETLTSLDSKIERTSRRMDAPIILPDRVQLDESQLSMTEKEFARGLKERFDGRR